MGRISIRCAKISMAAVLGALLAGSPALGAVDRHGAPTAVGRHGAPDHKVSHGTSTNWSGYDVTGAGPYTSVSSSWQQPAVDCSGTPTGYSAFWVGLDGDTTSTVEQTGTEADCSSGTPVYYGWYEMYPRYPVNYSNPISPGDSLSASVASLGGGYFRLTLTDTTKHWSQSTTQRLKSAKLGSAEAIAEAPSGRGILPLADFGAIPFSVATVNRSPLTASTPGIDPIRMVSNNGTLKAAPSAISSRGGFSDTWYAQ